MSHHLVGAAEVAALLGVSRQHVSTLANAKNTTFPEPEVELAAGRVWRREAIEQWMHDNPDRVGHQRPTCSFCGKRDDDVARLVQGPRLFDEQGERAGSIAICDECVELAAEIVLAEADDPSTVFPRLRSALK